MPTCNRTKWRILTCQEKKLLQEKLVKKEIELKDLSDDEFDELANDYYIKVVKEGERLLKTNPEQFISLDEFLAKLDKL